MTFSISKILVLVILAIFMTLTSLSFSFKEQVCLEDNLFGLVCYQSEINDTDYKAAKDLYEKFILYKKNNSMLFTDVVHYSDELKKGLSGNLNKKIKKEFDWVDRNSLISVIVIDGRAAFLIRKGEKGRYVLYGDIKTRKIVFDYNVSPQFLPIDKLWVNSQSLGLSITKTIFPLTAKGVCDIVKSDLAIFSSESHSTQDKKRCSYKKYVLRRKGSEVEIHLKDVNLISGEDEDIKKFLSYMVKDN